MTTASASPLQIHIDQIIRDFDFDQYGLHFTGTEQQQEWPTQLAAKIALAVAQDLAEAINRAWFNDPL